jgi:hypothetical protein
LRRRFVGFEHFETFLFGMAWMWTVFAGESGGFVLFEKLCDVMKLEDVVKRSSEEGGGGLSYCGRRNPGFQSSR